tara:strand:+ start:235 stop:441 length:207 start_codon:yes stop_codon:yes gene_type:complete
MKEVFGLLGNVKSSLKSTVIGIAFISLFCYNYVTTNIPLELMSVETVLLGVGVSLLFAKDGEVKDKDE